MTSFVVLQHEDEPHAKAAEKTVFVRDAFSIFALAFPIIWLFWNRLWIVGGLALVLFIAVSALVGQDGEYFWVLMVFNILLSLAVATEGPAWIMTAFRFSGYKDIAIIEAENLEQAQLRWALQGQSGDLSKAQKPELTPPLFLDDNLIFSANGRS
ncbi:MAG: DUF2628 domain-containing protein [Pseudomonadota bacterium]